MDFTLSGQVSRTLFISDSDSSTSAVIRDNNGATRVRANGSSDLDDGSTVGIQFEYAVDADVTLRHANVQYTNPVAGRITVGQGSEAGDGSAGLGPGVTGIGAGQDGTNMKAYFSSLDGGGRTNMVRYDTPSIGPMRAAFSIGNNDSISALLAVSSEFAGNTFGAQVGTHQRPRPGTAAMPSMRDPSTISASAGLTLASGLSVGGAWGRGDDLVGMAAMPAVTMSVNGSDWNAFWDRADTNGDGTHSDDELEAALEPYGGTLKGLLTGAGRDMNIRHCGERSTGSCREVAITRSKEETSVDPSYFRVGIGYTFGDTTVAASWYNSEDFVVTGSEGTAYGIGANHTLPKVGATFHASVQNYEVARPGMPDMDETVIQIGTLVTF